MDGILANITDWQGWMILGLALGVAEIIMPGIFLIWVAMAAALTGVVTLLLPLSLPIQVALFALLCIVATYTGRRIYKADPGETQDPLLNDRTARLIGEVVTVSEAISAGRGRVKVGDSEWLCKGPDSPAGAQVRIVSAKGSTLIVEPA